MSIENAVPREARFVEWLLLRTGSDSDKAMVARLRKAENPATEYQSWEYLEAFINIEHEHQRLPYITIAASMAKTRAERNGSKKFGQALAACYDDGKASDQAKAKLRRVLACDTLSELCRVMRPLLTLITSRLKEPLDYTRLLRQLVQFHYHPEKVKAQWAQEFFSTPAFNDEGDNV